MTGPEKLIVFAAKGFGSGCAPKAPGTFGSLVGLLWVAVLLIPGDRSLYLVATALGIPLSVWLCGRAEQILNLRDPGSVVIDEIIALPICFLPVVLTADGIRSVAEVFVETWHLPWILFGLFRLFDIWKPWPVHQSQSLPGGWGVTLDDVLAGLYVAAIAVFLR